MKFTVLGARGYVGSHLLEHLKASGIEADAPARGEELARRPLGHVVYAIGLTADFRSRPFETIEAHVTLLSHLLEQAEFDSLLYLSSTRFYPPRGKADPSTPIPLDPAEPDAIYDASKLLGEALCLRDERAVRVARLSNVYGGREPSPSFIQMVIEEAKRGKVVLRSSADSSKDFVHVDDVVGVLPQIALNGRRRTYNVASGENTKLGEIAQAVASACDATVRVAAGGPALVSPPIDVAPLVHEFGWKPRSVRDGLDQLLR